jgi:paraquat-inducible protein B
VSDGPHSNVDELPAAVPARSVWGRLPLVWILPAVVVLAGAFVVVREKIAQGTSVEITFQNAEGLEINKTKVRYKDVEIGEVRDIRVSDDRKEVIVTADIHRNSKSYWSMTLVFGWYGQGCPAPAYRAWRHWFPALT